MDATGPTVHIVLQPTMNHGGGYIELIFFPRILLDIGRKSDSGYIIHREAAKTLEKAQRLTDKQPALRTTITEGTYIDSCKVYNYE